VIGRRPFGVETEYAVTPVMGDGSVLPPLELASAMVRAAMRSRPYFPCSCGAGVFLGNGARLYVDAGAHPEVASPECHDPWDVVRYLRAGERLLQTLAADVCARNAFLADARVFAGNVDYRGATWGAHESYGHRAPAFTVRTHLLPHLVSRVIFCGAGGWHPPSHGLRFTLSPRAYYLKHVATDTSTHERAIVNMRQEPLAGRGHQRLHLICGESLRSDLAAWLRVGTTALIVALVDGGVPCGAEVRLARPLEALRTIAADPTCRAPVKRERGDSITAIQIQRHYLTEARAHLGDPFMPAWAGQVCDRWDEVLTRLDRDPESLSGTLDWAIKLAVYRDRVQRRGIAWDALPSWSRAIGSLERARQWCAPSSAALTAALVNQDEQLRAKAGRVAPVIARAGGRWDDFDTVVALGRELTELDMRWGLLGKGGLFHDLDRAGVLDHRVSGVDRIDEAVDHPPAAGRARVRGLLIQRSRSDPSRYACTWDQILDRKDLRLLDLSDPMAEEEHWRSLRPKKSEDGNATSGAGATDPGEDAAVLFDVQRLLARLRQGVRRSRTPERSD
jgi:proteasome accessory factor A